MAYFYPPRLSNNAPKWYEWLLVLVLFAVGALTLMVIHFFSTGRPVHAAVCIGAILTIGITMIVLAKSF